MRQIVVLSGSELLALRQGATLALAVGDQVVSLMVEGVAPRASGFPPTAADAPVNGNGPDPRRGRRRAWADADKRRVIADITAARARGESRTAACKRLGLAPSLYYHWKKFAPPPAAKKAHRA